MYLYFDKRFITERNVRFILSECVIRYAQFRRYFCGDFSLRYARIILRGVLDLAVHERSIICEYVRNEKCICIYTFVTLIHMKNL